MHSEEHHNTIEWKIFYFEAKIHKKNNKIIVNIKFIFTRMEISIRHSTVTPTLTDES